MGALDNLFFPRIWRNGVQVVSVPQAIEFLGDAVDVSTVSGRTQVNLRKRAEFNAGNSGTAKTIDFATNGNAQKVTLTGNCVFSWVMPPGVDECWLKLVQDATGGRFTTAGSSVKNWPSLTTTANTTSIVKLYFDGSFLWVHLYCTGVA